MQESRFLQFWYKTLSPTTPAELVAHWRDYELGGVLRGQAIVDSVHAYERLNSALVLDAGCGYGGTSIAFSLAGSRVIGVDLDPERLEGATIRACQDHHIVSLLLVQSALERLPFGGALFDVVVCADLLEHVQSQKQAIAEISRVLKPGGVAFVSFPNYLSLGNLRRDPHYGLSGVSILPRSVAAWYVVRVRRRSGSYGVGHLPIAGVIIRRFRQCGLDAIWQNPALRRDLGPLTTLVRTLRTNMYPLVQWVLRKR